MAKKSSGIKRIGFILFLLVIIIGTGFGFLVYKTAFAPNTKTGKNGKYLYIKNGATFNDVIDSLEQNDFLNDIESFKRLADYKKYQTSIKAGRYEIKAGINNNFLINKLRSGSQDAVKFVLFGVRKKEDLAGKISKKLEIDSLEFLEILNNSEVISKYGMNSDNMLSLFIPNTYQLFWNSTSEEVLSKFAQAYKSFWNEERKTAAKELNLTQTEVSVLASIVQAETNYKADKPIIAGVYLNRLKKGMPLEADPTLVWALNDFTIKRVLNKHKKVESPYNTYKYAGLPPGPINLPSVESLDAALHPTSHDYIYFCAKEDFSGASNFAVTLKEHLQNAKKYQKALSERGIMK